KDFGSSNNSFTGIGNNSNLLPTITDFTIAVDGNNQFIPMIVYNPKNRVSPVRYALNHESEHNRHHRVLEGHIWQHPPVRAPSWMLNKC
ncbi:MAG: hypothetical protein ACKPKO_35645, partial [Candidatus Fonsibacter sp.]